MPAPAAGAGPPLAGLAADSDPGLPCLAVEQVLALERVFARSPLSVAALVCGAWLARFAEPSVADRNAGCPAATDFFPAVRAAEP